MRSNDQQGPGGDQYTLHDQPLTHVGSAAAVDRMGWEALDLLPAGSIVLDVNDTDIAAAAGGIVTPYVGPALTELGGAATTGLDTPWIDWTYADVLESRFGASSYLRHTATALDPALAQHVIGVALVEARTQGSRPFFATRPSGGGRGFWFYTGSTGGTYVRVEGDAVVTSGSTLSGWGKQLASFTIDRGGNIRVYANGVLLDTDACPAGAIGAGSGIAIAGYPNAGIGRLNVVRMVLAYGTTLDAIGVDDWHQYLAECALGHLPRTRFEGDTRSTYARSSGRIYRPSGADPAYLLSTHCPPFGGGEAGSDGATVTVTSKNILPKNGENTTYLADADVGLTVAANPVDDSANLDTVVPGAGGVAFQVANPTGGELFLRLPNAIGGGAPATSWFSIRLRKAVDTGAVRLGWMTAAGAFTQVTASAADNYARNTGVGTPGAVTDKLALGLPAGSTTYFVLYAAGLGNAAPPDDPVSQTAVGASATIAQGALFTGIDPSDDVCTVETELTPDGWDGLTAQSPTGIETVTLGASNLLTIDARTNEATATDGTNSSVAITDLADGVQAAIRVAYTGDFLWLGQRGGLLAEGDYDGAVAGGTLVLRGGPWRGATIKVLRNANPGGVHR
jgi:hypothetical protein